MSVDVILGLKVATATEHDTLWSGVRCIRAQERCGRLSWQQRITMPLMESAGVAVQSDLDVTISDIPICAEALVLPSR